MNKIEIYYFSGSGNSLAVTRDIAEKINAKIINIRSIFDQEKVNSNADVLGFVFPIYEFKYPSLIEKNIRKFSNLKSKYIFAICTYGISPSKTMKKLDKLIMSYGGKLSGGFAIQMPHNGIGSSLFSKKEHQIFFKNWKNKVDYISKYITAEQKGRLETKNLISSIIFSGILFKMIPAILKLLKQVITKGWQSLVFTYNEKCDGCGICEKICPANNIRIIENKPSWLSEECTGCFACFHWCPEKSIQLGTVNMDIINYHHPDVKISDMINYN